MKKVYQGHMTFDLNPFLFATLVEVSQISLFMKKDPVFFRPRISPEMKIVLMNSVVLKAKLKTKLNVKSLQEVAFFKICFIVLVFRLSQNHKIINLYRYLLLSRNM